MRGTAAEGPGVGGRRRNPWRGWALAVVATAGAVPVRPAAAQAGGCALVSSTSGPPRDILRCPGGPVIEVEDDAAVRLRAPTGRGRPRGATVDAGAVLVDVPPGYPAGFQILTPRAVASVRGTSWVVDAQAERTSVFVLRGAVTVRRKAGGAAVTLGPGEGVDVASDAEPLAVKRWGAPRAAALLARFGR